MDLLLHTIALEPARWPDRGVFRPLAEIIPPIAAAGFDKLEIYEPHLALAPDEAGLVAALAAHGLIPVVLSSYLDLSPSATRADKFAQQARSLVARVARFDFSKVRLFPGRSASAGELDETLQAIAGRLRHLADCCPEVDFLLETHDGSLADDPAGVVSLVEICERANVGLLWQPTVFEPAAARAQFAVQTPYIRHCHLQNRDADGSFATLDAGVIPWRELLGALPAGAGASLEFVPAGICPPERFDLDATLQEAARELRMVRGWMRAVG